MFSLHPVLCLLPVGVLDEDRNTAKGGRIMRESGVRVG